ncbi:MAG: dihydrolipoamide acetyltransferase family protein [Candidatus Dormiibacterota bacterium]
MTGAMETFLLPDLGEGLAEAGIVRWLVHEGDTVAIDQPVVEVETSKAVVELPSPRAGTIATLHWQPGDVVAVGAALLSFVTTMEDALDDMPTETHPDVLVGFGPASAPSDGPRPRRRFDERKDRDPLGAAVVSGAGPAVVSPVVRRLARDLGIKLSTVAGSGPNGLILRSDVEAAAAATTRPPLPAADTTARGAMPPKPAVAKLIQSRREIPDVTVWVDVDASGLLAAKTALSAGATHPSITLLGLLGRICVLGLTRFPLLNARYDGDSGTIVPHESVHLGVAVASSHGLLVPVVRDAQLLTTEELCTQLTDTVERARTGVLNVRQLTGGTFTLNNYGNFNVDGSTPIINYPEAAILGIGRIMDRAWVVAGSVVARPVVTLSLAYDHRVCDGREAAEFLGFVRANIEAPKELLGQI